MEEGLLFIATIISGAFAFNFLKTEAKKTVKILLSFSGAFLLSTCVLHIIPTIYSQSTDFTHTGIFILIGFLLQIFLEFFSGGSEHGHIHAHGKSLPLGILISLCIHAFWEGAPFGFEHDHQHHLLAGIILHKIPVAVVIGFFLKNSETGKWKSYGILGLFALMPVLGASLIEITEMGASLFVPTLAIVLGMMLHISTTILFEASENHKFNTIKVVSIILGFALSIVSYVLI